MVVIAIIGVLATIVILSVSGGRRKAEHGKISNDLSNAIKVYNSCETFDGGLNLVPDTGQGPVDVCDTSDMSDAAEVSAASGAWSEVSAKYEYAPVVDDEIVRIQEVGNVASFISCTASSCGSWSE